MIARVRLAGMLSVHAARAASTALVGDRLTLAFLRGQSAGDTLETLDARVDGPSIAGTLRRSGATVRYEHQ